MKEETFEVMRGWSLKISLPIFITFSFFTNNCYACCAIICWEGGSECMQIVALVFTESAMARIYCG